MKTVTKIFVRFRDNPRKWIEKKEIDLGSLQKPNPDVLEIKIININQDDWENPFIRARFFGGF